MPVDPDGRGKPGENNTLAPLALDGDPTTEWHTKTYTTHSFFGTQAGVGLAVVVGEATNTLGLTIDGSHNGWGGQVFRRSQPGPTSGPCRPRSS